VDRALGLDDDGEMSLPDIMGFGQGGSNPFGAGGGGMMSEEDAIAAAIQASLCDQND